MNIRSFFKASNLLDAVVVFSLSFIVSALFAALVHLGILHVQYPIAARVAVVGYATSTLYTLVGGYMGYTARYAFGDTTTSRAAFIGGWTGFVVALGLSVYPLRRVAALIDIAQLDLHFFSLGMAVGLVKKSLDAIKEEDAYVERASGKPEQKNS